MFSNLPEKKNCFLAAFTLSSAKAFNPDKSKGVSFGNKSKALPNDKILEWSKLKAYADDKINLT